MVTLTAARTETVAGNAPSRAAAVGGPKRGKRSPSAWVLAALSVGLAALVAYGAFKPIWIQHELSAARRSLRQFEPKQAVERLAPLVARWPECGEAELLLGAAWRRDGQLDQAERHLARAAELGWDPGEVNRQRALMYFQAGDFRRSGDDVKALLIEQASDDEAEECYEAVVRGYISAMLLEQANFMLDGWISWRPHSAEAHLFRAEVATIRTNDEAEIAAYREILAFDPGHFEARRRLAQALLKKHEVDEALELFTSCVRDRPQDPDALQGLAEWHHRHGHSDEAKKLLSALVDGQAEPRQQAAALSLMGQVFLAEKDYESAERVFRQAVDADPNNMAILYSAAQVLSRRGHSDEAKSYIDRWERLHEIDEELEDLHPEILNNPQDPDLRCRIGKLLLEQGEQKAGVNWLLSVLFYHPMHPETNRLLADHYRRDGQPDMAARHQAMVDRQVADSAVAGAPGTASQPDAAGRDASPAGDRPAKNAPEAGD